MQSRRRWPGRGLGTFELATSSVSICWFLCSDGLSDTEHSMASSIFAPTICFTSAGVPFLVTAFKSPWDGVGLCPKVYQVLSPDKTRDMRTLGV